MWYLQRNLPAWERVLRLLAGAVAAVFAWWAQPSGAWLWVATAAALGLAATAIIGFCPACAMLGRAPTSQERR